MEFFRRLANGLPMNAEAKQELADSFQQQSAEAKCMIRNYFVNVLIENVPPQHKPTLEQWKRNIEEFSNVLLPAIQRPEASREDIRLLWSLMLAARIQDQREVNGESISRLRNLLHLDGQLADRDEEDES